MKKLLLKMKEYIEDAEADKDLYYGMNREANEIIKDRDVPKIYYEVLKALEKL